MDNDEAGRRAVGMRLTGVDAFAIDLLHNISEQPLRRMFGYEPGDQMVRVWTVLVPLSLYGALAPALSYVRWQFSTSCTPEPFNPLGVQTYRNSGIRPLQAADVISARSTGYGVIGVGNELDINFVKPFKDKDTVHTSMPDLGTLWDERPERWPGPTLEYLKSTSSTERHLVAYAEPLVSVSALHSARRKDALFSHLVNTHQIDRIMLLDKNTEAVHAAQHHTDVKRADLSGHRDARSTK